MTYSIKNVVGIAKLRGSSGKDFQAPRGFFGTAGSLLGDWGSLGDTVWVYLLGAHMGHTLEFLVALFCYWLLYWDGAWLEEAKTYQLSWVLKIVAFNLCCELVICNFWHWMMYANKGNAEALKPYKFNQENQYEPQGGSVGMLSSSSGQLQREVFFTTLGWLQSSFWQILFTHLWAIGYFSLPGTGFADYKYTLALLLFVTYWREIHFYWAHRGMHPWFHREKGLLDGDVGAFLYRHAHSLHHKSYNPGPWSGLCMHPVEHFLYYSCATLLPLVFPRVHPIVFLYCKFHADIAPIGGHDGHDDPAGNGDFHWLHHAKFECNYGVPFPINFDRLFGTWQDYKQWKENGCVMTMGSQRAMEEIRKAEACLASQLGEPLLQDVEVDPERIVDMAEVAMHTSRGSIWVVLQGRVLDVTKFVASHPGGEQELLTRAGKDVTRAFLPIHREGLKLLERYPEKIRQVGKIEA